MTKIKVSLERDNTSCWERKVVPLSLAGPPPLPDLPDLPDIGSGLPDLPAFGKPSNTTGFHVSYNLPSQVQEVLGFRLFQRRPSQRRRRQALLSAASFALGCFQS
jgi:hypothetical protein